MADTDKVVELCEEFAAQPIGTVVKFTAGKDFDTRPTTFRNKLHRQMRHDGWIVRSQVKGESVYAQIAGSAPGADPSTGVIESATPAPDDDMDSYGSDGDADATSSSPEPGSPPALFLAAR